MTEQPLYIGLDAGGSKTTLVASPSPSDAFLHREGPCANLQRQGLETTASVLASLIMQAVQAHPGTTEVSVCAGVAGAGDEAEQHALAAAVENRLAVHPRPLHIVHDATIALEGAFEGGSGIIVIAGTGSICFARTTNGQMLRAGGWGYLLGDEGSGHALGIAGLRAVAHAFDDGPSTRLSALLADHHGIDTPRALIHQVYREQWPVQQMAPLVVKAAEEDDAVASKLIREQTRLLAQQIAGLANRAEAITPRIALLGGLNKEPFYRQTLVSALLASLPEWIVQEPVAPPVIGALQLAIKNRM
ncbi:MAG TPA: BadF/BadG/BcrA/BcrD ATPase family protein [Rhodothermales bacterium]|nr:BadF/BadG/BcrA/BcrD ATPase family protein [Rhodothermales bacterium]